MGKDQSRGQSTQREGRDIRVSEFIDDIQRLMNDQACRVYQIVSKYRDPVVYSAAAQHRCCRCLLHAILVWYHDPHALVPALRRTAPINCIEPDGRCHQHNKHKPSPLDEPLVTSHSEPYYEPLRFSTRFTPEYHCPTQKGTMTRNQGRGVSKHAHPWATTNVSQMSQQNANQSSVRTKITIATSHEDHNASSPPRPQNKNIQQPLEPTKKERKNYSRDS
jgi:hypothetical protein